MPLERINELFAPGVKPWQAHGIVISKRREDSDRGTVNAYVNGPQKVEDLSSEEQSGVS